MRVLVTGGLGFLGSHLVDLLVKEDIAVTIIDDKSNNVIEYHPACKVVNNTIQEIFQAIGDVDIFSHIFHLASPVGPTGIFKYAGDIGKMVLNDTVLLRDYCIKTNTVLIDISTSEVYGHSGTLFEESEKVYPGLYEIRTEYGGAKMLAEMALVNYARINEELSFQIVRPFNIAGPRQQPEGGFVLPRFIVAALTDQPITVYGDGSQIRAFTDVRDIVSAIFMIAESGVRNEIWNIGNLKNEMSILELAEYVSDRVMDKFPEKKCGIIKIDPQDIHGLLFAEVPDKVPYSEKVIRRTGWVPKISLEQTIDDTIEYFIQKIDKGYNFNVMETS